MKKTITNIILLFLLMLSVGALQAQGDKGVTRTGKAVDCSTINPSVDKAVNEHGKIVTHPRVTRNGKLITDDCGCPITLDCTSCTDTVNCVSIATSATISSGTVTSAVLQIFSDAGYTSQVGSDIVASIVEGKITALADNLACNTRYYLRLILNNNNNCSFDWTDSTRDMTLEKVTTCAVANNLSNEHLYETGLIDSVRDHEGNAYSVVQIGNQCWMKENMRATTTPNGTVILQQPAATTTKNEPRAYYYNDTIASVAKYGVLYNWPAAMDTTFTDATRPGEMEFPNRQGICPAGWHLPTDVDWYNMEIAVEPDATNINTSEVGSQGESTDIAVSLSSGCDWEGDGGTGITPNSYANAHRNETGFSAIPAGYYDGNFKSSGYYATFWSANSVSPSRTLGRGLTNSIAGMNRNNTYDNDFGRSVRCVRDKECDYIPATSCSVTSARGLDGTADRSHEHLMAGTTDRIDSVYDHEGNAYGVVQIGNQCWLKQNMRCTTSPRQGSIMGDSVMTLKRSSSDTSYCIPYYYETATQFTLSESGYLYNWAATIDTVTSASFNRSFTNRRGICPAGWHIPTYDEWTTLERGYLTMLGSDTPIDETELNRSEAYRGAGSGKFTSSCYWQGSGETTSPRSYSYADRNCTGLSILPTGYFNGNLMGVYTYAPIWSSTSYSKNEAWYRRWINNSQGVYNDHFPPKYYGRSVRCLRDVIIPEMTVCEDTILGTITVNAIKNTEKIDFIQGNTVVKSIDIQDTVIVVNDLADGTYKVKAISASGDTLVDNARMKHTHSYCTGVARGNELGTGTQIDSVFDHEGNWYEVVQIGNQCWLKENMRATTKIDGTNILELPISVATADHQQACYFQDSLYYKSQYGVLYNWPAVMNDATTEGCRGICPEGWHVPTKAEWQTMIQAAGAQKNPSILAASCIWKNSENTGAPGLTTIPHNTTQFSALPAGTRIETLFGELKTSAFFWTSSNENTTRAWVVRLKYDADSIQNYSDGKLVGRSLRCVRNTEYTISAVIDSVSCNEMFVSAEVLGLGTLTDKTVCAYTDETCSGTPVCADNADIRVSNDSVYATIKNLNCDTRYYVKVTATDGVHPLGTVVTDSTRDMSLTQNTSCPVIAKFDHETYVSGSTTEINSVRDVDGNTYKVVQIGTQCWLAENLRVKHYPDSTTELVGSLSPTSSATAYYYSSEAVNGFTPSAMQEKFGLIYNWQTAVAGTAGDNNCQGICPDGWHVGTNDEFNDLMVYAGMITESQRTSTGLTGSYAGRLAASCDWRGSHSATNNGSYPDNIHYSDRNKYFFSALPAGWYDTETAGLSAIDRWHNSVGTITGFWTSSTSGSTNSLQFNIRNSSESRGRNATKRANGYSVRCVRDNFLPSFDICTDTSFGHVTFSNFDRVAKLEVVNSSNDVVKTALNPTNTILYTDLPDGNYTLRSLSKSGRTAEESMTIKHTYTHCTGTPNSGTDLGGGKFANKEWGTGTQIDSVSDHQGNVYQVVQIGGQCWLKQNMRCTTIPNGTDIMNYPTTTQADNVPYGYYYNDDPSDVMRYGILYNWSAAMNGAATSGATPSGVQGICPAGWHLPSNAEYTILTTTTEVTQTVSGTTGSNAGRLVTGCDWANNESTTSPGNYSYSDRNISGFSAVPAGNFGGVDKSGARFGFKGERNFLWTSTATGDEIAYYRLIAYNIEFTKITSNTKYSGRSVRCIRNPEYSISVVVDSVSCGEMFVTANVIGLGTITNKTVCAYTDETCSGTPICATGGDIQVSGSAITANIKNLDCNTRYYVKVTATDGPHNAEGATTDSTRDMSLVTVTTCNVAAVRALTSGTDLSHEHAYEGSTTEIDSVYDHEGNAYAVVQIGEQCWLKENMHATTSPTTGHKIEMELKFSNSSKCAGWYNNNSATYAKYGMLYNWCAAVDTFYAAGGKPELANDPTHSSTGWDCNLPLGYRRGICPKGWHIPEDGEWFALEKEVLGVQQSDSTREELFKGSNIGRLVGGCDWKSSNTTSHAGYYLYSERNSSGFGALPAGYYGGTFQYDTEIAFFWSASQVNDSKAVRRLIAYNSDGMKRSKGNLQDGFSVRCLRDYPVPVTISFNANGGTGTMDTMHVMTMTDTVLNANNGAIARVGNWEFAGWNTDRGGRGTAYADNAHITPTESITLYAQWHSYCTVSSARAQQGTDKSHEALMSGYTDRIDTVYDHEGNDYTVLTINNLCITKQNLRVTTSPTGKTMEKDSGFSIATAKWNEKPEFGDDGYLYNWSAAVDTSTSSGITRILEPRRGLCPQGWHIPSDDEFFTLIDGYNTGNFAAFNNSFEGEPWASSSVDNVPGNVTDPDKNLTGFSAIPVGYYGNIDDPSYGVGTSFAMWSSHINDGSSAFSGRIRSNYSTFEHSYLPTKGYELSVRCIRDAEYSISVVIDSVSCTEMLVSADVNGLSAITNKTVCAYTDAACTSTPVCAASGDVRVSNDSIYATVTGLNCNTRYYVKVTATDGTLNAATIVTDSTRDMTLETVTTCNVNLIRALTAGTDLSHEHAYEGSTTEIDSVYDHEGNAYAVVQIGNQCWMKENMRTAQTNTGVNLANQTSAGNTSTTAKYYYVPAKADRYGYLYNYLAANNICPSGWHLPTDAEWKTMVEAAGATDGNTSGTGLAMLTTGCDWTSVTGNASVAKPGNYEYANRNLSGFSALPAGEWNGGFWADGSAAEFWTATENGSNAYYRGFGYSDTGTDRGDFQRHRAYSVRCIRD